MEDTYDDEDDQQQLAGGSSNDESNTDGESAYETESDNEDGHTVAQVPDDVKQIRSCVSNDLRDLMYEQDVDMFHQKLDTFEKRWASSQQSFWGYFHRYWISNEKFKRWAKCYQPAMYTNMETNNYVESWHRVLKHSYLRNKRNQRLDLLIHILVDRVEPDMLWKARVYKNRVGPMSPEDAFCRSLERKAEEFLSQGGMQDPVERVGDDIFLVCSFDKASSEQYRVVQMLVKCFTS